MLSTEEIRAIAQKVVDDSKETAHVDQGTLRRSISYTYIRGVLTFREIFYGQYNDNSQLEKNASRNVPYGTEWRILYTDVNGDEYEKTTTRSGRKSQRLVKKKISNRVRNDNTNKLISLIQKRKKDGEKKK